MGQKMNPISNRLPLTRGWTSQWFATRDYGDRLIEDLQIRQLIERRFQRQAAIGKVEIKRTAGGQIHIFIHTAKPGIVIGRSGGTVAELRVQIEKLLGIKREKKSSKARKGAAGPGQTTGSRLKIDIIEIRTPELVAQLVAENMASQIERRMAHRRVIRQTIDRVMQAGAKGVRIEMAGRLGGAEIARSEKVTRGSVPLSTFRADIDYAQVRALTSYGTIGIKTWIHRGELADQISEDSHLTV